jgi:hypothetical protein
MGIATRVFRLSRGGGAAGCAHYVLARAARPSYAGADAGAEDAADAFASSALDHLTGWWARWRLPLDCRAEHALATVGETSSLVYDDGMEADPDLWDGPGLREVHVWTATGDRAGWIVVGAARDEAAFWAGVAEDRDLDGMRLRRPAQRLAAYLLTDLDGSGDLRDR